MPDISVIIPVYNVGRYLNKCLNSVVNQTLRDVEIIVVNDGSTDNSCDIINSFQQKDNRIKVINKENEGLAMARKSGLAIATGQYVQHLDGDDYFQPDALELLYNKALEEDADIVTMNFYFDYIDQQRIVASTENPVKKFTNIEFFNSVARGYNYWAVWSYLHKRSLYDNNILFNKELCYGEDVYLTTQLVYRAKKIVSLSSHPLLNYQIRLDSITGSQFNEKKYSDILLYPLLVKAFMEDKPEYERLKESVVSIRIIAYALLFQKRCFKNAVPHSRDAMTLLKQYPDLRKVPSIKAFVKLFRLFSINWYFGRLFAQYYMMKNKI